MAEVREARLVLPGAGASTAAVAAVAQPSARRTTRALAIALVTVAVAPISFLLPPHLLWPLIVLSVGGYFAWREWWGEYVIESFEGTCPRCEEPLSVDPGTRARGRHRIECYGCHREPELILADADRG